MSEFKPKACLNVDELRSQWGYVVQLQHERRGLIVNRAKSAIEREELNQGGWTIPFDLLTNTLTVTELPAVLLDAAMRTREASDREEQRLRAAVLSDNLLAMQALWLNWNTLAKLRTRCRTVEAVRVLFCEDSGAGRPLMQPDFKLMRRSYPDQLSASKLFDTLEQHFEWSGREATLGVREDFITQWKASEWPYTEDGIYHPPTYNKLTQSLSDCLA